MKDIGILVAPLTAMKSAAVVTDEEIYKVDTTPPPAGEADAYNAPTKVGYLPGTVAEEVRAALAPTPLPAFDSFFPPDDTSRPVVPRTSSGEYERVVFHTAGKKLEFEKQVEVDSPVDDFKPLVLKEVEPPVMQTAVTPPTTVVKLQEETVLIPRKRKSVGLGWLWMVGMALASAGAVFVCLWLMGAFVR